MKVGMIGMALIGMVLSAPAFAVKVGDTLPKLAVQDGAGKAAEPWAGKPTLINFWATWCDACKVELKEMEAEVKVLSPDHRVVFVSLDKEPQKAKDYFAKEFKSSPVMASSLYHDAGFTLPEALNVESFPMTLIVDGTGKVLKIQDGFKPGTGSTSALFETLRKSKN